MNHVILIGRLARDPELSYTPNTQTAACRITLAVDRPKRNGDAQGADYVRSADFIRVTVWGRQAETCDRYLSKGRQIAVMGRIQTGSYKNRNGETVYTTDVVAERVEFLGGGQQMTGKLESAENTMDAGTESTMSQPKSKIDEPQIAMGFDDLPDTFAAAEDDIPF